MMDDILARLRAIQNMSHQYVVGSDIMRDAADEIDRLRAEVAELRKRIAEMEAQEPVAWMLVWTYDGDESDSRLYDDERHCYLDAQRDGGICRPLYASPIPATPSAAVAVPDDATCEALIEASDMRWNGDVYVGDGADLMNLVRSARATRTSAPADDNRCASCGDIHDTLTPCAVAAASKQGGV